jgi:tripartite-type tricarboxylate transporter receptor subunit TctC
LTLKLLIGAFAGALLAASSALTPAVAQEFTKPLRIVVAAPPGGTSDILARLIAPELSEAVGQPVVVENKAGAGSNIGADYVAKAEPDAHTLLLMDVSTLATAPWLYSDLSYDPTNDLAPVTMISFSPYIFAVNPQLEIDNVEALVALGEEDPRALRIGNSGIGSATHLAGVMLGDHLGLDWTTIPYRGGSESSRAVVSGEATVIINGSTATLPFVKSGQLTGIALTGDSRLDDLPDMPTFGELGLAADQMGSWQGLLTTGGSSEELVERLGEEVRRIVESPEMQARVAEQGARTATGTSQEFSTWLADSTETYGEIIQQFGITIQ